MGVRLVVAVTDGDWFDHLRALPLLTEVNFWSPSDRTFRALQPGELFLFKLHAPRNVIGGGGWFAHSTILPCSLAWEAFGEENGAATLREMRARIARYTKRSADDREDFPYWLPDSHPAVLPAGTCVDSGQRPLAAQRRLVQDLLDRRRRREAPVGQGAGGDQRARIAGIFRAVCAQLWGAAARPPAPRPGRVSRSRDRQLSSPLRRDA